MSTWREKAAPIIRKVIADNAGATHQELRALLRDAYPFGERKYHPYKIWCDEVNAQLGTKKIKPRKAREAKPVAVNEPTLWEVAA